jgi:hypothetical protein
VKGTNGKRFLKARKRQLFHDEVVILSGVRRRSRRTQSKDLRFAGSVRYCALAISTASAVNDVPLNLPEKARDNKTRIDFADVFHSNGATM